MLTYRNEASFSKALVTAMRNKGWFVQRIESGETGKGIPDLYVIDSRKQAWWIELKRVHKICSRFSQEIPWRPGQQAWLHDITKRGQRALTLCCFDNGILQILHERIWEENKVDPQQCKISSNIGDLLK